MKNIVKILVLGALLSSLSFAGIVANGTFTFNSTGGAITYSPGGGLMIDATTITIPIPNASTNCGTSGNICEQVTSIPGTYLGNTNDFSVAGNTPLNINDDVTFTNYSFDLSFASLPVFHFTGQDGNRFTFTATNGVKGVTSLAGSDFLNIAYTGTFSDSLGFYNTSSAALSLTFTQTGGNTGAVGFTGTFATPPSASQVPEPATMASVGGVLIAAGLFARKKMVRR